ncbi:NifB/NifX family molybdenum-iron cluster-binding protein [Marinitoga litoralis]|uniref:NifB/NifX family molybdenum-iron cluster-binding protein n=1 Tax=Marinitoga litoralis TaxID=570855 RepID=UPI001960D3F3|nr:NifB/NifX family molybdenum-iron cluster-binding protein [Marinitoga litoralis]MBM7559971.1 putative Fe-Mo cluster-binding NifX family protein [Marinitoga litoralis]
MKIAIPLIENLGKDSRISEHFGRAPYFGLIEYKDNGDYDLEIIENPLVIHQPGEVPTFMKNNGVNLVIARGMGERGYLILKKFGINVIRGANGTVDEIMKLFKEDKLKDVEFHNHDHHHHHH